MKTFLFLTSTIFFSLLLFVGLDHLDPGSKLNINMKNIIIISSLLLFTISSIYLFTISLLIKYSTYTYHYLRSIIIGILGSGLFLLKASQLLSIFTLIIVIVIYILAELTLIEIKKNNI